MKGLLDRAAFLQWRVDYEAAGIDSAEVPPQELIAAAAHARMFVSSDIRRAVESALLVADGRNVIASPLLRELSLDPPRLRWIRLPMVGWALMYGMLWLKRAILRHPHVSRDEEQRARDAADWLVELSQTQGDVIALTHASFRSLVAKELVRRGWTLTVPRRRLSHWSAWTLAPRT